jgi:hypothetical protein
MDTFATTHFKIPTSMELIADEFGPVAFGIVVQAGSD